MPINVEGLRLVHPRFVEEMTSCTEESSKCPLRIMSRTVHRVNLVPYVENFLNFRCISHCTVLIDAARVVEIDIRNVDYFRRKYVLLASPLVLVRCVALVVPDGRLGASVMLVRFGPILSFLHDQRVVSAVLSVRV